MGERDSAGAAPLVVGSIVTPDYVDRALAVALSLRAAGCPCRLELLTTRPVTVELEDVAVTSLDELGGRDRRARALPRTYGADPDALRWSLKPVFLTHLLRKHAGGPVLLCDSDLCFFDRPDALLAGLDAGGLVLTPHWRPLDPTGARLDFRLNFMDGLFNAGCVAANERGIAALDWWAQACAAACERDPARGLYVDQRYLDLMVVYFPEAVICRDPGFNVANWNRHLRTPDAGGRRPVPDRWPVRMVHFTGDTIREIEQGRDPLLLPLYVRYLELRAQAERILFVQSLRAPPGGGPRPLPFDVEDPMQASETGGPFDGEHGSEPPEPPDAAPELEDEGAPSRNLS